MKNRASLEAAARSCGSLLVGNYQVASNPQVRRSVQQHAQQRTGV